MTNKNKFTLSSTIISGLLALICVFLGFGLNMQSNLVNIQMQSQTELMELNILTKDIVRELKTVKSQIDTNIIHINNNTQVLKKHTKKIHKLENYHK